MLSSFYRLETWNQNQPLLSLASERIDVLCIWRRCRRWYNIKTNQRSVAIALTHTRRPSEKRQAHENATATAPRNFCFDSFHLRWLVDLPTRAHRRPLAVASLSAAPSTHFVRSDYSYKRRRALPAVCAWLNRQRMLLLLFGERANPKRKNEGIAAKWDFYERLARQYSTRIRTSSNKLPVIVARRSPFCYFSFYLPVTR